MKKKSSVLVSLHPVFKLLIMSIVLVAVVFFVTAYKNTLALTPEIRIQLSDGGCGNHAGGEAATTGGWSGFTSDSNGYDPDCARVYLSGLSENTDFRVGIKLSDHGSAGCNAEMGSGELSPWASDGGGYTGWATDGNAYDPDCAEVYIETRAAPAGVSIQNPKVEIGASDHACSSELGGTSTTPSSGGWSDWIADGNSYDYDCLRLNLLADIVPLGKVTVFTQAYDSEGHTISFPPSVNWIMSGPAGAPNCNGTNSTGQTCERMPFGNYTISPSTDQVQSDGKTYKFSVVSVSATQMLGTTSAPAGQCASGESNPHLHLSGGQCTSVNSCGASTCTTGGGGGPDNGPPQQLIFLPKDDSILSKIGAFIRNITPQAFALTRNVCTPEDSSTNCGPEDDGNPIPTPPPPPPPAPPTQIYFTIQYQQVAPITPVTASCSYSSTTGNITFTTNSDSNYCFVRNDDRPSSVNPAPSDSTFPPLSSQSLHLTGGSATYNPGAQAAGSSHQGSIFCQTTTGTTITNPNSGWNYCQYTVGTPSSYLVRAFANPTAGGSPTASQTATPGTAAVIQLNPSNGYSVHSGTESMADTCPKFGNKYNTNVTVFTTGTINDNCDSTFNYDQITGTISANPSPCVVPVNGTSCNTFLSWTTTNSRVGDTSSVTSPYPSANTTVFTGNSSTSAQTSTPVTVPLVGRTFYLYNQGNTSYLNSVTVQASCAWGSIQSGGTCVATAQPTDGICSSQHYNCLQGISTGTTGDTASAYNWTCSGFNQGNDAQCSEAKIPLGGTVSGTHDGYGNSPSGNNGTVAVGASQCQAAGWAAYSGNTSQDLNIRILSDGVQVATDTSNIYRSDLQTAGVCGDGTCAFTTNLNGKITYGVNHTITTQAQNPSSMVWTTLNQSPRTINCTAPDLTAAAPTPATAIGGTAQTYYATVTNIGTAATGASFPYFFQTATLTAGAGTITNLASSSMNALAINGTGAATSPSVNFASGTTPSIRVCVDGTSPGAGGVIVESNENNNCSPWTDVNMSGGQPDLVAGVISPISASVNASTPFYSTITNSGAASTGGTFTNLFQTSPSSTGASGVVDYAASPAMASLSSTPGSNSASSQQAITFSAVGTMYVRACADKSSAGSTGGITESNENNNCSVWTAVTVSNVVNPPASSSGVDLTALNVIQNPTPAVLNGNTTLSATIKNQGSASTGGSFINLMQTSTAADGSTNLNSYQISGMMPALAAGASGSVYRDVKFNSPGDYYVRFCADKSSGADVNGRIAEPDNTYAYENNNCSIWKYVPVPAPVDSGWSGWSDCSVACGTGVQTRTCAGATNGGNYCTPDADGLALSRDCSNPTPPACAPGVPVTPVCSPTHYLCSSATQPSTNRLKVGAGWTWTCTGTGGTSVSCSETTKKTPIIKEN